LLRHVAETANEALSDDVKHRLPALALVCCASVCTAETPNQAANGTLPRTEQAEPQYPFGGFLFTGPRDALEKLRQYGEGLGLKFVLYPQPPSQPALLLSGEAAFRKMKATTDLVKKSQAGKFGEVRLGLISEPPPR
jgi:hypothetical protein